jgi:hypothetical protein
MEGVCGQREAKRHVCTYYIKGIFSISTKNLIEVLTPSLPMNSKVYSLILRIFSLTKSSQNI